MGRKYYYRNRPKKSFSKVFTEVILMVLVVLVGYWILFSVATNSIRNLGHKKRVIESVQTVKSAVSSFPFDMIDVVIVICMIIAAMVLFSVLTGVKKREQDGVLELIRKSAPKNVDPVGDAPSADKQITPPESDDRVRKAEVDPFTRMSKPKEAEPKIYKKKCDKVLTDFEAKMYDRLKEAFPDHLIQYQVSLSQLVEVDKEMTSWVRRGHFSKIARLVLDFVIVDQDHNVVACIELDDWTHKRPDRMDADRRKNEALRSAGYKLLRYTSIPGVEELRRDVID